MLVDSFFNTRKRKEKDRHVLRGDYNLERGFLPHLQGTKRDTNVINCPIPLCLLNDNIPLDLFLYERYIRTIHI